MLFVFWLSAVEMADRMMQCSSCSMWKVREIVGDPVGIVSGYSFRKLELQPQDHLENDNFLEKSRRDVYAKVQEETRLGGNEERE